MIHQASLSSLVVARFEGQEDKSHSPILCHGFLCFLIDLLVLLNFIAARLLVIVSVYALEMNFNAFHLYLLNESFEILC